MRLLLLLATLSAAAGPARAAVDPFVRVDGAHFAVDGHAFAFVGANLEVMHGEEARARAAETIAAAAGDGLTVGRVWALGEGDARSPAWSRRHQLFRAGPAEWLDDAPRQLDRVLAAAHTHGLRVIITLANYWPDYGGVPQYLAWAGLPSDGFAASDRFFSESAVRALYRAHLERLLARTNALTGVRYVDDPTIFAWELMNESQVATEAGARARLDWIDEMATLVKTRDRHHLVTPGVMGYSSRAERAQWLAACKLPAVDYCDSHLYPETTDRVGSRARLEQYIDDRVQLAQHVAHKPIVFGEFGFHTTEAQFLARPRADWFGDFLGRAFFDGAAGALAWIYQPWGGHARDFGIYVDRGDTDDVRATLQRFAQVARAAPASRNPLLADARGDGLLYDPYVVEARSRHQHWRDGAAELPPSSFAGARWERLGSWGVGPEAHAFGAGDGWFDYAFVLPRAGAATLEAQLSSEWPGRTAPADGGSRVAVSVDGAAVATLDVVPDDGVGRSERVALGTLARGRHVVRLRVAAGASAHGLCVYGDEAHPLRVILTR